MVLLLRGRVLSWVRMTGWVAVSAVVCALEGERDKSAVRIA